MPGTIQSIERAAAVLHFLGAVPEPVALGELAHALGLPKPTTHGIVRTLVGVGFVVQHPETGHYAIGTGLTRLGETLDPHLLRSRAANWADGLVALSGLEVELGILTGGTVELLHHVFRPDGSPQRLRVGERQPLHATALGLALLAFAPAASRPRDLVLTSYTSATVTSVLELTRSVQQTARRGWSLADGTHRPGIASLAAPIRHHAGLGVGALAVLGPRERVLTGSGEPLPGLVEQVVGAAAAVSARLQERL
ncbi:IclR family transcriptional regulator [Nocardioides plantarum]|uniref:IclR family transcriptional regulator n=1 Tax=Nocardioides plantarum TaxID=29299 RepID=A0ABV5KB02_9ACTN|nr:IclR family transcriptional regulator C-terminal domain-containing protein [Nocardioides plantarum]